MKFYSASSLLGFRSAIHRKLVELKLPMNVHSDPAFKDANIALKAFLMKPKKAGEVKAVEHKHPINDDDMSKLSRYFQDLPYRQYRLQLLERIVPLKMNATGCADCCVV